MCSEAANGIMLQCGKEYGFAGESSMRATDPPALTEEQLHGLPTGNLNDIFRSLTTMHAGKVAKCRNRKFTGKSIRNDVMLYRGVQTKVDPAMKLVTKLLNEREAVWTDNQKKVMSERIGEKLMRAANFNTMIMKLLKDCKLWNGPVTSSDELINVLKKRPDQQRFILRTELAYFTHTHKTEKTQRPDLFRQNCISDEEKLENLCILLSDDAEESTATVANLPTNEDGMKVLSSAAAAFEDPIVSKTNYEINQLCITLWMDGKNEIVWYVGYITEINEETYVVDHLHRNPNGQNKYWMYPHTQDKKAVE